MDNPNRLSPTSVTPTLDRQTPRGDFGQVLADNMGQLVRVGGALANGLSNGSPVVSAAVSSVAALAAVASAGVSAVGAVGSRPSSTLAGSLGGPQSLETALRSSELASREYLVLQNEMQRESREFNTISNIIKVRHDSAKAAINNIR